jgi:hypothetical protein
VKGLATNATGTYKATINLLRKEMKSDRKLLTPKKTWKAKHVTEKHASFMESAICKKCINFFSGKKF